MGNFVEDFKDFLKRVVNLSRLFVFDSMQHPQAAADIGPVDVVPLFVDARGTESFRNLSVHFIKIKRTALDLDRFQVWIFGKLSHHGWGDVARPQGNAFHAGHAFQSPE